MARPNIPQMKVAYFLDKELSINNIIEKHIELVTKPIVKVLNFDIIDGKCVEETKVLREAKPAPRKAVLYAKYVYLIHTIIVRCMSNKKFCTRLSYDIMESTLGEHYGDMLMTLEELGVIFLSQVYEVGIFGRTIFLKNTNIDYTITNNKLVIKYAKKVSASIEKFTNNALKQYGDDDFIKNYQNSLSKLELIKKDNALEYICQKELKKDGSKPFYIAKINNFEFDTKQIYSIDKNKRIYHYLTNLPRELKQFFNIKFQIDIANSHPLLFSLFLIKRYNISNNLLNNLINNNIEYLTEYKWYHYSPQQLCNQLNDSDIEVLCNSIPVDVLKYIYRTSKGDFWDDFCVDEIDRSELKKKMFEEVFYSRKSIIKNKTFAKFFRREYPFVWSLIKDLKEESSTHIANGMMANESDLFYKILKQCYAQNWKVINIHDAVVVLDVEENENVTTDAVRDIVNSVYNDAQLYPTLHVD